MFKLLHIAASDLLQSVASWRLWSLLGWLEVRQRYARSIIGPFWLTISMSVMICSIGVIYGTLFGLNVREYLPFLSVGLVMWTFLAQVINEGSLIYISNGSYIRQTATPKLIYVLQVVWRNLIVLGHNAVIVVVLMLVFGVKDPAAIPMFVPALLVFLLNVFWVAMIVGLLSARFRDLPQVIAAFLQVSFYVTPVIFQPAALAKYPWVVKFNPLAYLLELVRAPLLGRFPDAATWEVAIGMAVIGWLVAMLMTAKYLKRIPYWV